MLAQHISRYADNLNKLYYQINGINNNSGSIMIAELLSTKRVLLSAIYDIEGVLNQLKIDNISFDRIKQHLKTDNVPVLLSTDARFFDEAARLGCSVIDLLEAKQILLEEDEYTEASRQLTALLSQNPLRLPPAPSSGALEEDRYSIISNAVVLSKGSLFSKPPIVRFHRAYDHLLNYIDKKRIDEKQAEKYRAAVALQKEILQILGFDTSGIATTKQSVDVGLFLGAIDEISIEAVRAILSYINSVFLDPTSKARIFKATLSSELERIFSNFKDVLEDMNTLLESSNSPGMDFNQSKNILFLIGY